MDDYVFKISEEHLDFLVKECIHTEQFGLIRDFVEKYFNSKEAENIIKDLIRKTIIENIDFDEIKKFAINSAKAKAIQIVQKQMNQEN